MGTDAENRENSMPCLKTLAAKGTGRHKRNTLPPAMLHRFDQALMFIFVSLPPVWAIWLRVKEMKCLRRWLFAFIAASAICYLALVVSTRFETLYLEQELEKFDLNGDGWFSPNELTQPARAAMNAVAFDTGRNLAPLTGLFTCPAYAFFWFGLIGTPYFLYLRIKRLKDAKTELRRGGIEFGRHRL